MPLPTNLNVSTRLARGDRATGRAAHLIINGGVRWTKRRVFVQGDVTIQERRDGKDGDTRYRGTFQKIVAPSIPSGCEIAQVTPGIGSLVEGPRGASEFTRTATGLIAKARCQTDHGRRRHQDRARGCWDVDLGTVQVRLRPATTTCKPQTFALLKGTIGVTDVTAGDRELGGERPGFKLDATVEFNGDRVTLKTNLVLAEYAGDKTRLAGGQILELFDAALDAPGCRVTHVSPSLGALNGRPSGAEQYKGVRYRGSPGNLIQTAWCRTNAAGNDLTLAGCGEVVYRTIIVSLTKK